MISRTNKEVSDAFNAFRQHYSVHPARDYTDEFWRFCGVTDMKLIHKYANYTGIWMFPPEVAHRIDLLNSPHVYAILKAMEANGQLNKAIELAKLDDKSARIVVP